MPDDNYFKLNDLTAVIGTCRTDGHYVWIVLDGDGHYLGLMRPCGVRLLVYRYAPKDDAHEHEYIGTRESVESGLAEFAPRESSPRVFEYKGSVKASKLR